MKPLRLHLITGMSEETLRKHVRDFGKYVPILSPATDVQVIRLRPAMGYWPSLCAHSHNVK